MKIKKLFGGFVLFFLLTILVSAYSEYGSPTEFGNLTDTTCYVGGDDGEVNCTGPGYFDSMNLTNENWIEDQQESSLDVNSSNHLNEFNTSTLANDDENKLTVKQSWLESLFYTIIQIEVFNTSLYGIFYTQAEIELMNNTLDDKIDVLNASKINITDQFGGDLNGTYDNISVKDNSHLLHWDNISNKFITAVDDDYIYMDDTTATFNTSKLDIIYYNASSVDVIAGAIEDGNIISTNVFDDVSLNISESDGTPGLDVRFNFTGVEDFNQLILRYKTDPNKDHQTIISLWDFVNSRWYDHDFYIESVNWDNPYIPLWDSTIHIGTGADEGRVLVRVYFGERGKSTHVHYYDFLQLSLGTGTFSSTEVDPLSYHKDENINAQNYNGTFDTLSGSLDCGNLTGNVSDLCTITDTDTTYVCSDWASCSDNSLWDANKLDGQHGSYYLDDTTIDNCSVDNSCPLITYESDSISCFRLEGNTSDLCTLEDTDTNTNCSESGGCATVFQGTNQVLDQSGFDHANNTNYPPACSEDYYVTQTGDSNTCTYLVDTDTNLTETDVENYIFDDGIHCGNLTGNTSDLCTLTDTTIGNCSVDGSCDAILYDSEYSAVSPGGADTNIQYQNGSGDFQGESGLTWDETNDILTVDGAKIYRGTQTYDLAVGYSAGLPSSGGGYNTVFGSVAGGLLSSGYDNSFFGALAGRQIKAGHSNVAIGRMALFTSYDDYANTAIGSYSMYKMRGTAGSSSGNLGIGAGTLRYPTVASDNVAIGWKALEGTLGEGPITGNTAIGAYCGEDLVTGSRNLLIGANSGKDLTTGSDNILIQCGSTLTTTNDYFCFGNLMTGDLVSGNLDFNAISATHINTTDWSNVSITTSQIIDYSDSDSNLTGADIVSHVGNWSDVKSDYYNKTEIEVFNNTLYKATQIEGMNTTLWVNISVLEASGFVDTNTWWTIKEEDFINNSNTLELNWTSINDTIIEFNNTVEGKFSNDTYVDAQDLVYNNSITGKFSNDTYVDAQDILYNNSIGGKFATENTNCSVDLSCDDTLLYESELNTFVELQSQIADETLIKAGTLTNNKVCKYFSFTDEVVCNYDFTVDTDTNLTEFDVEQYVFDDGIHCGNLTGNSSDLCTLIDTTIGNCSVDMSCEPILYESELNTLSELNTQIGVTLTQTQTLTAGKWCIYENTPSGIQCTVEPVIDTNCTDDNSCPLITYNSEIDTFEELNATVADADLIKGGTMTDTYFCFYDSGTDIVNCNRDVIEETELTTLAHLNTQIGTNIYDFDEVISDNVCAEDSGVINCNLEKSDFDYYKNESDRVDALVQYGFARLLGGLSVGQGESAFGVGTSEAYNSIGLTYDGGTGQFTIAGTGYHEITFNPIVGCTGITLVDIRLRGNGNELMSTQPTCHSSTDPIPLPLLYAGQLTAGMIINATIDPVGAFDLSFLEGSSIMIRRLS